MAATKKRSGSELAAAAPEVLDLPGATKVDDKLVDSAVEEINRLHSAKGLELARAMGEYLVKTFFGGDLDNFGVEKSHASWRALANREDLQVSHSTLWFSVAILAQLRQLPEDVGTALSVSHHRLLVPVRDPKAKERVARKAVEQGLTVSQFEAEVAKVRKTEKRSKGGRPAIPPHLKALRRLPRLLEPVSEFAVTTDDVELLGQDRMKELLADLEAQISTLRAAQNEIQTALKGAKDP